MKYFLTGATGFIGGHLARLLLADGHEVVALVRDPGKAAPLEKLGATLVAGDITDRASLAPAMAGADGIFHLAAWYKVGAHPAPAEAINIDGTRNVLEAMRELGIPKGVYTSTLAVFSNTRGRLVDESYRFEGRHLSAYDETKWRAHYEVALPMMAAGLPLVIVQPGMVYGPGDTSQMGEALRDYLLRRLPVLPKMSAFCWGHVEDTARAHCLAMEKGAVGESYIIAGPPHTFIEALAIAERLTGIPAPRLRPGPALMKTAARLASLFESWLPLPESYRSESLRVMAGATYLGDNTKARRELGFDPRPLETGLEETLEFEMKRLGLS